jgi:hypothetical protein
MEFCDIIKPSTQVGDGLCKKMAGIIYARGITLTAFSAEPVFGESRAKLKKGKTNFALNVAIKNGKKACQKAKNLKIFAKPALVKNLQHGKVALHQKELE